MKYKVDYNVMKGAFIDLSEIVWVVLGNIIKKERHEK